MASGDPHIPPLDPQGPAMVPTLPDVGTDSPDVGTLAPIAGPLTPLPQIGVDHQEVTVLSVGSSGASGKVQFTPAYYKALQASHGEKPKSSKRGRPTKCTPELTAAICARLEKGNYLEVACASEGVSAEALYTWMRRARDGNTDFKAFLQAVEKAIAIGEARDVDHIDTFAPLDWRAAAWRLSHRSPRRWGDSKGERPDTDPMTGSPMATVQDSHGLGLLAERLANLETEALLAMTHNLLGPPGRQLPPAQIIDVVPGPAPSGTDLVAPESQQSPAPDPAQADG